MELSFTQKKSLRKSFGKLVETLSIPNLIEVQKNSYQEFLTSKNSSIKNDELLRGLEKVFSEFNLKKGIKPENLNEIDLLKQYPKLIKKINLKIFALRAK